MISVDQLQVIVYNVNRLGKFNFDIRGVSESVRSIVTDAQISVRLPNHPSLKYCHIEQTPRSVSKHNEVT